MDISTMKRNDLLKQLQTHQKYKNKTYKQITEKLDGVSDMRKELTKLTLRQLPSPLPSDIKSELLLNMDIDTLVNACQTDKQYNTLCHQNSFWIKKMNYDSLPIIENPKNLKEWIAEYRKVFNAQQKVDRLIKVLDYESSDEEVNIDLQIMDFTKKIKLPKNIHLIDNDLAVYIFYSKDEISIQDIEDESSESTEEITSISLHDLKQLLTSILYFYPNQDMLDFNGFSYFLENLQKSLKIADNKILYKKYKDRLDFLKKLVNKKDTVKTEVSKTVKKDTVKKEVNKKEEVKPVDESFLSAKKVLSTILLNSDTETILHEYMVDYLKTHPSILQQAINRGLYHVYARTQDEFSSCEGTKKKPRNHEVFLVKSFITEGEAKDWILKNGKNIVLNEEDNYDQPIVLTIIHDDNKGTHYPGEWPAYAYEISSKLYPTFVFSKKAYDMLLYEYDVAESRHRDLPSDKHWIHYIK